MIMSKGERLDLPPCKHCGSRLTVRNGTNRFLCKSCGSQYGIPVKVDHRFIPENNDRPNCPRCNYDKPWKRGEGFYCKMCGKYFEQLEEF